MGDYGRLFEDYIKGVAIGAAVGGMVIGVALIVTILKFAGKL